MFDCDNIVLFFIVIVIYFYLFCMCWQRNVTVDRYYEIQSKQLMARAMC
jgi:hypothetical protein